MSHSHEHFVSGKRLFLTIILNIFITLLQIIGGIAANSLSLLSDAFHNFSDVLALVISYIANTFTKKDYSSSKTFGYKRAEILAAFINSAFLFIIAFLLIKEAVMRLIYPAEVKPFLIVTLAGLSIIINTLSVLLLLRDSKKSLNIKSAYLHLLTDVFTSIIVLVGGLSIYYLNIYWIDAVLTLIISVFLIYSSFGILLKTMEIFMQFAPKNIDIKQIEKEILKIKEIKNIHHIHIWQLNEHDIHLEAHIDFNKDIKLSAVTKIINKINKLMKKKFHISHTVFQPEFGAKDDKSIVVKGGKNG